MCKFTDYFYNTYQDHAPPICQGRNLELLPHASSVNDGQVVHSIINANINSFYIGLATDLPDCYKTLKPAWFMAGWKGT